MEGEARLRPIRVNWTGKKPPTKREQNAIARGVRDGKIRSGDRVGPGRARRAVNVSGAARAYKRFHWGRNPKRVQAKRLPSYDQGLYALGKLRAVEYETKKGNEHAIYVHKFSRPYPTLTGTPSGKLGPIIGGGAFITERGIEK